MTRKIEVGQTLNDFLSSWWKQIDHSVERSRKIEMLTDAATILWGGCQTEMGQEEILTGISEWLEEVNPM